MLNKKSDQEMRFVLVVDNGKMDRKRISDELQKDSYYVSFASDAETALRILIKVRPFIIFVGLALPTLDSCTFTRILKNDEDTNEIHIVGLSGVKALPKKLAMCGFDGLVNNKKPEQTFLQEIKKFI